MLNPTDRPLSDLQFSLVDQKTFKEVSFNVRRTTEI